MKQVILQVFSNYSPEDAKYSYLFWIFDRNSVDINLNKGKLRSWNYIAFLLNILRLNAYVGKKMFINIHTNFNSINCEEPLKFLLLRPALAMTILTVLFLHPPPAKRQCGQTENRQHKKQPQTWNLKRITKVAKAQPRRRYLTILTY